MPITEAVSKIKPLKRILYPMYRLKKEHQYRLAFKQRLKEIGDTNVEINDPLNVIIVTADCLRFKNTSLNEYERNTTPFLSSIRNSGKAIASAPWTHPSVASIMTGMYPHNHGAYIHLKVRNFDNPRAIKGIRKKFITLTEIAGLNNYEVYFATSIAVATFPMGGRAPVRLYPGETRGDTIVSDFFKWLNKVGNRNFFAYIHLGDTHQPLNPPRKFRDYFGRVENLKNIEIWAFQKPQEQQGREFERFKKNKVLLYDNTIRYVDYLFEKIHRGIEKRGLLDNTVIVFTADHGEEFWEHAKLEAQNFYDPRGIYGVGHGHNVFNEIIEVPLAVEGPVHNLKIDNRPLVDLFPTILKLWKTEVPYKLDGRPLNEKPRPFLMSEATGYGYEKKAFIVNGLKFLYAPDDGVEWVFLMNRDPQESNPLKDADITENMRKKLLSILARDEVRSKLER
ncbi:sulfatase [Thermococcus sp.]